jgi:hypothetical protein
MSACAAPLKTIKQPHAACEILLFIVPLSSSQWWVLLAKKELAPEREPGLQVCHNSTRTDPKKNPAKRALPRPFRPSNQPWVPSGPTERLRV